MGNGRMVSTLCFGHENSIINSENIELYENVERSWTMDTKEQSLNGMFDAMEALRKETVHCTESLILALENDRWMDDASFQAVSHALLALGDRQSKLKAQCEKQGIQLSSTVAESRRQVEAWLAARKKAALRDQYRAVLREVLQLVYTGTDAMVGEKIADIKKEAESLLVLSLTVEELAKRTTRFTILLSVVKAAKKDYSTFIELGSHFPQEMLALSLALQQGELTLEPVPPAAPGREEPEKLPEKKAPRGGKRPQEVKQPMTESEAVPEEKEAEPDLPVVPNLPEPVVTEPSLPDKDRLWYFDMAQAKVEESPFPAKYKGKKFIGEIDRRALGYQKLDKKLLHTLWDDGTLGVGKVSNGQNPDAETLPPAVLESATDRLYAMGYIRRITVEEEAFWTLTEGCRREINSSQYIRKNLQITGGGAMGNNGEKMTLVTCWRGHIVHRLFSSLMNETGADRLSLLPRPGTDGAVMRVQIKDDKGQVKGSFDVMIPLFSHEDLEHEYPLAEVYVKGVPAKERSSVILVLPVLEKFQAEPWVSYFNDCGISHVEVWKVNWKEPCAPIGKSWLLDEYAPKPSTGGDPVPDAKAEAPAENVPAHPLPAEHAEKAQEKTDALDAAGGTGTLPELEHETEKPERAEEKAVETPNANKKSEPDVSLPVEEKETAGQEMPEQISMQYHETAEEMLAAAEKEFAAGHLPEGMMLLHGMDIRLQKPWIQNLAGEVGYVLQDPLCQKKAAGPRDGFDWWGLMLALPGGDGEEAQDYLHSAALLRSFFEADPKDYRIQMVWKQMNDMNGGVIERIPELKQLMNLFKEFGKHHGLSLSGALELSGDPHQWLEMQRGRIEQELALQKDMVQAALRKQITYKRAKWMVTRLFRQEGDLSLYLDQAETLSPEELLEFCQQFTDEPLSGALDRRLLNQDSLVSEAKVSAYLDEAWKNTDTKLKKNENFKGSVRDWLANLVKNMVQALLHYAVFKKLLAGFGGKGVVTAGTLDVVRGEAKTLFQTAGEKLAGESPKTDAARMMLCVLNGLLTQLSTIFSGKELDPFYASFLKSGYIEFDNATHPDISFSFGIPGFDLYARTVCHIQWMAEGDHASLPWNDLYKIQLERFNQGICRTMAELYPRQLGIHQEIGKRGSQFLSQALNNFRGDMELAYNYSQIGQNQMENYFHLGEAVAVHLEQTENYGLLQDFSAACRAQVEEDSALRRADVQSRFERLKDRLSQNEDTGDVEKFPIVQRIQRCLSRNNLSVAEDYIQKCSDEKIQDIPDVEGNMEAFREFLYNYQTYYQICTRNGPAGLSGIYRRWKEQRGHRSRETAQDRNEKEFVDQWAAMQSGRADKLMSLLSNLSYDMTSAEINVEKQSKRIVAQVKWKNPGQIHLAYRHPFAKFGTGAYKKGMQLVIFFGNHSPQNIVNELTEARIRRDLGTICFVDISLGLGERRMLAKLMKTDVNMENILVVDRVMELYLLKTERLNRGNALLELALPFASVSPYVDKGPIQPEMFMGRTRELREIRNMDGPVFVYGGRQLGKSALLRQVQYIDHHPKEGSYAYYLEIKDAGISGTLRKIGEALTGKGHFLPKIPENWEEFGHMMREKLQSDSVSKCMLLLDESDAFLSEASNKGDKPIEILTEIRNSSDGKFKFVLAGLHDVIRFDKHYLGANTVRAQLSSLIIRPFSYMEASELLMKPLSYMGFQLENPELLSTILSKTNYFPGLIQFYGKKLIDVKNAYQSGQFSDADNPPYILNEAYLKGLLRDEEFRKNIEEKFMITLRLDKDDYYNIIALAVAFCYHCDGSAPVTAAQVKDCCAAYGIQKIMQRKEAEVEAYMEEMVDLNILRKDGDRGFIFNRYSFFSMLGSDDKIEKELNGYGQQAVEG